MTCSLWRKELDESSTCSVLEHMGNDSKQVYETKYYNLDAILSVGYRVNSKYNCGPSAQTAATHRKKTENAIFLVFLHIIMYIALCTRKGGITDHSRASGVVRFCL